MIEALSHTRLMALRHARSLIRQPWYVAFTLVQPVLYMVLFGELFERVADLPGFPAGSYITFLTPGVVAMMALFSAGWNGVGMIEDLDRGVLDRFLVSPVSRVSLIAGRIVVLALTLVVQGAILLALGRLLGARYGGGPIGILVGLGTAVLLAAPFGALSNAVALMSRRQESLVGVANFVVSPLTFLSTVFMTEELVPGWIATVAAYNPVTWAVEAAREAMSGAVDWGSVGLRAGGLAAIAVVLVLAASRALRAYTRSV
ncbi:MAG TPA: ABC transporter permease [Actinomycetota bacterium]|nr:ABC transporter permease [Actinomycetota bacterium]